MVCHSHTPPPFPAGYCHIQRHQSRQMQRAGFSDTHRLHVWLVPRNPLRCRNWMWWNHWGRGDNSWLVQRETKWTVKRFKDRLHWPTNVKSSFGSVITWQCCPWCSFQMCNDYHHDSCPSYGPSHEPPQWRNKEDCRRWTVKTPSITRDYSHWKINQKGLSYWKWKLSSVSPDVLWRTHVKYITKDLFLFTFGVNGML